MSIETAFPFLNEKNHVISLVGGGGKTTLMYALAEIARKKGHRVLVTTTTHIRKPAGESLIQNEAQLRQCWKQGTLAVAGEEAADGKLAMPEPGKLVQFMRLADMTFIEADGAKGKPCKVPADHEPVIIPQSDIVIGVMGLDALGCPIGKACFRVEEVCKFLGKTPEEILTEQDMARILSAETGTKKGVGNREYYVVLNKYDLLRSSKEREQAEKLEEMLWQEGICNVVRASAKYNGCKAGM